MNSIYLGDIDPNNSITSPLDIRRNFMYRLLIWDSIVLSDSQFLTDPRINLMMGGFPSENLAEKMKMEDVDDFHRGFEQLLANGFVEIACRKDRQEKYSLGRLYDDMVHRSSKVPYLPANTSYPDYLDSLHFEERVFELHDIENRFRENLLKGVGSAQFPNTSRAENEISELFHREKINFSTILDLLKSKLQSGEISQANYERIYEFVYGCYSINVSAETGCYLSTEFKNIPLHLDCGTGDFAKKVGQDVFDKMRPTWALQPTFLDHISFEDFVQLKEQIKGFLDRKVIMEFFNGILTEDKLDSFYDIWDMYTRCLEATIKEFLRKSQVRTYEKMLQLSKVKVEQKTILSGSWEVVTSVLGMVPGIGSVLGVVDIGNSSLNYIRSISHKTQWNALVEQHKEITKLLAPDAKIITKYS